MTEVMVALFAPVIVIFAFLVVAAGVVTAFVDVIEILRDVLG